MENHILLQRDPEVSRIKQRKQWNMQAPHFHEEHELYYMVEGRTTYFIADEIYSVEEGEFVFIPKGIPHMTEYRKGGYNERILLSFPDTVFTEKTIAFMEELAVLRVIKIPENYRELLEQVLYRIEAEYRRKERDNALMDLYIQELFALLCRHQCEKKRNTYPSDSSIAYAVSGYINTHYDQEITLESLSRTFAFSEEYLSRKFKETSGIGMNQYLNYVRVSNGERMLRESTLSMTQIAQKCGFSNSNYFAAVFKKIKGITPGMYRKQYCKKAVKELE